MKYLLIDDMANYGWKSVIEKAIIKDESSLDIAVNELEAIDKLKSEWHLIFLDMRLSESDHGKQKIEELSGFKLLKIIKKEFGSINFCTPIILITASNKIWNVNAFKENGIDGFYIKEHPDYQFDKESSILNLENAQNDFNNLIYEGNRRREVWTLCNSIIKKLSNHTYFKNNDNANIQSRILDKIKLGYAQLFQKQSMVEKNILLSCNESLAFIVFWSILEELSKGFTFFKDTWDDEFRRDTNWKFKNGEYFIFLDKNEIILNFAKADKRNYIKGVFRSSISSNEAKKYLDNAVVKLSDQIYALLSAYSINDVEFNELCQLFKPLNRYRNETDFIHGSVKNIFRKKLIDDFTIRNANVKILELLIFIDRILTLKLK